MEISGKCIKILDAQRFSSKKDGSTIVKNGFVLETQGQYPKKVAFGVMGEERFANFHLVVGESFNVSFDVESREWQGRWFTECVAWRVVSLGNGGAQVVQAKDADNDDKPF